MSFELPAPGRGYPVRLPAITGSNWPYPTLVFQARNRAIQRARSEPDSGERVNVEDHCITMLFAIGEAGQDKKRRIGSHYYVPKSIVSRNTLNVNPCERDELRSKHAGRSASEPRQSLNSGMTQRVLPDPFHQVRHQLRGQGMAQQRVRPLILPLNRDFIRFGGCRFFLVILRIAAQMAMHSSQI